MAYEVLARKWRPQSFDQVIGQEHITQTLQNAVATSRLAHAYLFSGPRGVGKTSVARILAKAMNCEERGGDVPCNHCKSCTEITGGSSVDVQEIDGASNRGIDEIRELRENIKYMPSSGEFRVYVIDEVHMLTLPAFNALLKTLEEPPAHVKFIFATTEAHKVPVTILSRCQRFDFKRIPFALIVDHLNSIVREEGISVDESGLSLIAREAEGSMRDAESLLDQVVSFAGAQVSAKHVTEILGIIDSEVVSRASRAVLDGSAAECMEIIEQIYNYGYDLKEFYGALMNHFRNLLVSLVAPGKHLLDLSVDQQKEISEEASSVGRAKLQSLLDFLITHEEDLRFTSHPRVILEAVLTRLCLLDDFLSFEELLEKMASLEKRLMGIPAAGGEGYAGEVSDTVGQWDSAGSEGPKHAGPKEEDEAEAKDWKGFLSFISSKSKPMYNVLKGWHLVEKGDDTICIGRAMQSFSSAFFDDKERYGQLVEYCRTFFEKDVRVEIVANNTAQTSDDSHSGSQSTSPGKTGEREELPKPVQDIVSVFRGEIQAETPNGGGAAAPPSEKVRGE